MISNKSNESKKKLNEVSTQLSNHNASYLELIYKGKTGILYIGSSVTIQKDSYRYSLQNLFKKICEGTEPESTLASLGGVGISQAAFFAIERIDELLEPPKLCFIEYSVNDIFNGNLHENSNTGLVSLQQHFHRLEKSIDILLNKLKSIGCRVVFLHMYKQVHREELYRQIPKILTNRLKMFYPNGLTERNYVMSTYDRFSRIYDLLTIDVDAYFANLIEKEKFKESELIQDSVHTTALGSQLAAEYIFDQLKIAPILLQSMPTEKPKNQYKIIRPKFSNFQPSNVKKHSLKNQLVSAEYFEILPGTQFKIILHGRLCGLALIAGPRARIVLLKTKEVELRINTHTPYSFTDRFNLYPLHLDVDGELTLECLVDPVDLSGCKARYERDQVKLASYCHEGMKVLLEVESGARAPSLSLVGLLLDFSP